MLDTVLFICVVIFGAFIALSVFINVMECNYNRKHPEPEVGFIVISRAIPSFYGLCGTKLVKRKISDRRLCIDLIHGVDNPEINGWYVDYIQYK
jgi:hypothetical protein